MGKTKLLHTSFTCERLAVYVYVFLNYKLGWISWNKFHKWKISPNYCVIRCVFNKWAWPNFFKQFSQVKDFSSVYVSRCCLKLLAWLNFYKQISHVKGFSPVCVNSSVLNTGTDKFLWKRFTTEISPKYVSVDVSLIHGHD